LNLKQNVLPSHLGLLIFILLLVFNIPTLARSKIYLFNLPLPEISPAKITGKTLLVSMPKAAPGFNTQALVSTKNGYEIKFDFDNQWIDTPAQMLLPWLVYYLEATGQFRAVLSATTVPIVAELRLDTEILCLQQDISTEPNQVHLVLRAQLFDMTERQVQATKIFQEWVNLPFKAPEGSVIATNTALERILKKLTQFVIE